MTSMQLYISCSSGEAVITVIGAARCLAEIKAWLVDRTVIMEIHHHGLR